MNQAATDSTKEVTWIPLKDAARILGCSVKTIRRRITGGTWRSMIEYQGQKAIRLVAREDVLRDSVLLNRIPADSAETALALQALDGLPVQMGDVLKSYLSHLKKEMDRVGRIWRIYLFLSVAAAAVIFGGVGYYLSARQEKALQARIADVSRTLSTTLSRGQDGLEQELSRISARTTETRRLAEEAGEQQGRSLEMLMEAVKGLEEVSREARGETAAARMELESLRREVARLESVLRRGEEVPEMPVEISPANEESGFEEDSPPADGLPEENKRSRFLGIF